MSKTLNISNILNKDFRQVYVDNEPTNIFINSEGRIKTKSIKEDPVSGNLSIRPSGCVKIEPESDTYIKLGGGTGFVQGSAEDSSNVTIDFRETNKFRLDMAGGSISGTLTLKFPNVSGNFVLLVAQDGSTRTINAYAITNSNGTAGTLKWAGGSAPDLTDGNSKTDILSFYYDDTNNVAYGVASLDF